MDATTITGLVVLTLLFLLEGLIPFYRDRGGRMRHAARNLALALAGGAVAAVLAPLVLLTIEVAERSKFGLSHMLDLPPLLHVMILLLLFDLWMYAWHRANHRLPFLWRFHRVHHTDTAMDSTTALRFHPGELALSTLSNCVVLALLGMSIETFALYKALMIAVILFHHSNVALPAHIDRRLRALVVTPSMHRVHHSRERAETDSNYGTILSCWDRLLGSFRLRIRYDDIRFGIGAYENAEWQRPVRLLALPLQPRPALTADRA